MGQGAQTGKDYFLHREVLKVNEYGFPLQVGRTGKKAQIAPAKLCFGGYSSENLDIDGLIQLAVKKG